MIRKVTAADREIYLALANEFYHSDAVYAPVPTAHMELTLDEVLKSNQYAELYMLCVEEEIAGYALLSKTFSQEAGGMLIWIEEVYVRDGFRGHGLGKEFFAFLDQTHSASMKRYRLEVEDYNTGAISLYERLGFKKSPYDQMIRDL